MFKKILIANRGEIAVRVMRTAKKLGIATVAVYSDADRDAVHVSMADEAVHIGEAPSASSYLVIDRIVEACKSTGADAVHPGYGFLSENAAFAEALEAAGIAFVGPGVKAINAMGDKITSKKIAIDAGVNTVPGHTDVIKDAEHAVKIASDIGYPVMLKASAGGGGKGMRVANDEAECRDGFERATSEAKSSFGDDRVFIEKFVVQPRHIEIQVLADTHGNVVHLGERECSIQRRHQKVVEEAPSPFVDAQTRKAMGEQAKTLAKAVDYKSAGTVEFIVDKDRNFYFLEMNTRLQVEHPVTELVTGLDLVEEMLRVAAGDKLKIKQSDVEMNGWAMETRIYAEDPARGFLPSIGRLKGYSEPTGDGVRVDSGVREGGEISMFYDPMISKLITYGDTRIEAIDAMSAALDDYWIDGVTTNSAFLQAMMRHERFRSGNITTGFIEEEFGDEFVAPDPDATTRQEFALMASLVRRVELERRVTLSGKLDPYRGSTVPEALVVKALGHSSTFAIDGYDGSWQIDDGEKTISVNSEFQAGGSRLLAEIDGVPWVGSVTRSGNSLTISRGGYSVKCLVLEPRVAALSHHMIEKVPPDMSKYLVSPMPGLLIRVAVKPGQQIKAGEELAVVEAMKMENVLRAERDGEISEVLAEEGASLAVDQPIISFA